MLIRLLVLALLVAALPGLWLVVRSWGRVRSIRRVGRESHPELTAGKPTVLFFTGEYCTVCEYRQKPALQGLREQHDGDLRVVELDAAREHALSKRFGVLSLPTTVVLAPDGLVSAVNYGFAPRDQLDAQLRSLAS